MTRDSNVHMVEQCLMKGAEDGSFFDEYIRMCDMVSQGYSDDLHGLPNLLLEVDE